MDYEQKYAKALEIAEKYWNSPRTCFDIDILAEIFPQLKESEDERIRKALICGMHALKSQCKEYFASIPIDNIIAWLEKQGEQKHVDNIEPKFKVGDWVVLNGNPNSTYQVEKIENYHYVLTHRLGGTIHIPFGSENSMSLWTKIQYK